MRSETNDKVAAGGNFPSRTPNYRALSIIEEDHGRAQLLLGSIVGGLHVAPVEKDQELVARLKEDGIAQMAAGRRRRLEGEQAVELTPQAALMRPDGRVGKIGTPAADGAGVLQEALAARAHAAIVARHRELAQFAQNPGRVHANQSLSRKVGTLLVPRVEDSRTEEDCRAYWIEPRRVFERVVEACIAAGLVGGEDFAVDASLIVADANKQRSIAGKDWDKNQTQRRRAEP